MKRHKITKVDEGGIAEELGIEEGDFLLAINDKEIEDIFDYDFIVNDEYLEVLIEKANGEEWLLEVEKDYDEDLGMEFGESLMDEYRSCFNKCVFCFIDQNPPGMRETIYFKDDDTRLSFLQGNYVTLTNMKEKDIQRIIDYKLAPINISVHTTNPELRCQMLHNRFAGKVMDYIQMLYDADIPMNAQVVLCKGLNDGDELRRTIGGSARLCTDDRESVGRTGRTVQVPGWALSAGELHEGGCEGSHLDYRGLPTAGDGEVWRAFRACE